jgi:hypothetical protein
LSSLAVAESEHRRLAADDDERDEVVAGRIRRAIARDARNTAHDPPGRHRRKLRLPRRREDYDGFANVAIAPLEAALGRPVLTSNQVLLWNVLASAGVRFTIGGYGQLFAHEPP